MKVAFVHDWLVTYAGSERVLGEMLACFPDADVFATVDFVPEDKRAFLRGKTLRTSYIQKLPFAGKKYQYYLPFMPLAVEQFDLTGYDLVVSSSHAVAKGIITGPDQLHICMCYSPMRYAWDLQHLYLDEIGLTSGLRSLIVRWLLHKLRIWDVRTANGVDEFIAISRYIERRIRKVYRRDSRVIYPPVDVEAFTFAPQKDDFYLTASRIVPYKRIDLIVEAFSAMPDKKLVVIGDGPEFDTVKAKAGPNVTLMGYQPFDVLRDHMQRARAFLFAAEEDFGIIPIEAQACGTPVIAFGRGGALETIRGGEGAKRARTGTFFMEQTPAAICDAVAQFEAEAATITPEACRENAMRFSRERFRDEFKSFVADAMAQRRADLARDT